jgi:hypothetical protein
MPTGQTESTKVKDEVLTGEEYGPAYNMTFENCTFNNCTFNQTGKPSGDPPPPPPGTGNP